MLLDDLVNVIDTLQKRIHAHRPSLQQNETRTRTALIDPLLSALGWDVADPSLVTPEYNVGQGRADYGLMNGTDPRPVAMVEAKRLNHPLSDDERMQMLNYANVRGTPYAAVTDGDIWEVYDVFKMTPAPLEDRRLLSVRIDKLPAHELALELLLLWRPNLASGSPITARRSLLGIRQEPATTEASGQPLEIPIAQNSPSPSLSTSSPASKAEVGSLGRNEYEEKQTALTTTRAADPEPSENRGHRCRYRVNGEDWNPVSNATNLLLAILRWCAQEHGFGKDEYYRMLSITSYSGRESSPKIIVWKDTQLNREDYYSGDDVDGWRIFKNLSNTNKSKLVEKMLTFCTRQDGTHPVLEKDLWVEMPNT